MKIRVIICVSILLLQAASVDAEIQESSTESAFTLVPYKCIKWLPSLEKLDMFFCHAIRVVFDFGGLVMPLPSKEEEDEVDDHFHGTDIQRHCSCLMCLAATPPPAREDQSRKGRKSSTKSTSSSNAPKEVRDN